VFKNRLILLATDFSPFSAAAFELACSLARDNSCRVLVLHVIPPPKSHAEVIARVQEGDRYQDQLWEDLKQIRPTDPDIRVELRLENGDPVDVILEVAESAGCDMIVVGTHGRTGLARMIMGSVAEQIIRRSKCPVLAVKKPHVESA
jgi:nucleotide-binding universal stress UspA family protein